MTFPIGTLRDTVLLMLMTPYSVVYVIREAVRNYRTAHALTNPIGARCWVASGRGETLTLFGWSEEFVGVIWGRKLSKPMITGDL